MPEGGGASGAVSRGSPAGVSGGGPCFTAEAQLAPKVALEGRKLQRSLGLTSPPARLRSSSRNPL